MSKKIDLTGQRFGRLVVIGEAGRNRHGDVLWRCRCDCTNEVIVKSSHLINGHTTSCGCRRGCPTHGMSKTRLYRVWADMLVRTGIWKCSSENFKRNYEERGIEVCDDWLSFEKFRDWALTHGYSDDLEIDRKDNNRGYCPENCQWVSRKENVNNRRCTLRLPDGTSLAMFCTKVGIQTRENGKMSNQYSRITYAYNKHHKAHPELVQKANETIDLYLDTLIAVKVLEIVRHYSAQLRTLLQKLSPESSSLPSADLQQAK